jgi:hypothetical protein
VTRPVLVALLALAAFTVTDVGGHSVSGGTASATRGAASSCLRPYAPGSPWNRPIGRSPRYDPQSDFHLAALDGALTSDPRSYTFPVYEVTSRTPTQPVSLSGWFSHTSAGGKRLRNTQGAVVQVPIPASARPAAGSDGQIIVVNRSTGEEWGFWRAERRAGGGWSATNGYRYNVRWSGVAPVSGSKFTARGSGIPYLAGLVRRCEIARGRIDHALAFAYDYPAGSFVHPATKSDGKGSSPADLPEGARLQLDPKLTRSQIQSWGCRRACLTIARALQTYGMYVVDNAGREKIMVEYGGTARWDGLLTSRTVSPIPLHAFELLRLGAVKQP